MPRTNPDRIEPAMSRLWFLGVVCIAVTLPVAVVTGLRIACVFGCPTPIATPLPTPNMNSIAFNYSFVGETPPLAVQTQITEAFHLWQLFLLNSTEIFSLSAGTYCSGTLVIPYDMDVDGIYMVIRYEEIAAESVLAQAGVCVYNQGMPRVGMIILDKTSMMSLIATPRVISEIIAHEIGHVLGIGTHWEYGVDYLMENDGYPGYPYLNANANAAHVSYGGQGARARVEDEGGGGTRGAHWDEGVYDNELMTGYVESSDKYNHLSLISLGALVDIGFVVNDTIARARLLYVLPTTSVVKRRLRENKKRYNYTDCIIDFS